jgi:hypothetical protein
VANNKNAGRKVWQGVPVLLKVVALCVVAFLALLLILPPPPERSAGGTTSVGKYVPPFRDTVDPLASKTPPPAPPHAASIVRAPESEQDPPAQSQAAPQIATASDVQNVPAAPPPTPSRKPAHVPPAAPDGSEAGGDTAQQALPWTSERETASLTPPADQRTDDGGQAAGLPSKSDIRDWLKSQAWEFLGGVDPQGNILYRFEVWLDAPREVLDGIKSVTYEYDAPSATPAAREIDQKKGGFRARFGSLACAKNVKITVTMETGRTRRTTADGCRALN